MKLKYFKEVNYVSYKGGVNNLQIVNVYNPDIFSRRHIVKTFTSVKGKALERADYWITKKNN